MGEKRRSGVAHGPILIPLSGSGLKVKRFGPGIAAGRLLVPSVIKHHIIKCDVKELDTFASLLG